MAKDGAMPGGDLPKKYHLENQDKEYELVVQYLGWHPNGYPNWDEWAQKDLFKLSEDKKDPELLVIFSPNKKERVELLMDHALIKDAFLISFFGEERTKNWWRFYKVARKENPDVQFVIPLH